MEKTQVEYIKERIESWIKMAEHNSTMEGQFFPPAVLLAYYRGQITAYKDVLDILDILER